MKGVQALREQLAGGVWRFICECGDKFKAPTQEAAEAAFLLHANGSRNHGGWR